MRASIKTLKIHLNGTEPDSYIDENGFLRSKNSVPSGDIERIRKVANEYYNYSDKKGRITFGEERFNYLKRIVALSKRYQIMLYVMLTPEHINCIKKFKRIRNLPKNSNL